MRNSEPAGFGNSQPRIQYHSAFFGRGAAVHAEVEAVVEDRAGDVVVAIDHDGLAVHAPASVSESGGSAAAALAANSESTSRQLRIGGDDMLPAARWGWDDREQAAGCWRRCRLPAALGMEVLAAAPQEVTQLPGGRALHQHRRAAQRRADDAGGLGRRAVRVPEPAGRRGHHDRVKTNFFRAVREARSGGGAPPASGAP
jgi:hypothetical protein